MNRFYITAIIMFVTLWACMQMQFGALRNDLQLHYEDTIQHLEQENQFLEEWNQLLREWNQILKDASQPSE